MKEYFINLINYENWANKEVTDCIVSLNDPPEKSLALMSHIINAQMLWLSRIKNETAGTTVWKLYSKSEISEKLEKSSKQLEEFINNLSESNLMKVVSYTNTKGEQFESKISDILTHLTHHSAYHRGQIILLIKPLVNILPYTDFIHFARNVK